MNQVRMKNNKHRRLIERVAHDPNVPDALTRDIVNLAQRHLQATVRGRNPQHRDVSWAVTRAWKEWSRRFCAELEARSTRAADTPLHSAA